MPGNPLNLLNDIGNTISEGAEDLIEPAVDLAEDVAEEAGDALQQLGETLEHAVGDTLEQMGLDPSELSDAFANLDGEAIEALIDFFQALAVLQDKLSNLTAAQAAYDGIDKDSLSDYMAAPVVSLGLVMIDSMAYVQQALHVVLALLSSLVDLLPDLGLEGVLIDVDPRFESWLDTPPQIIPTGLGQ